MAVRIPDGYLTRPVASTVYNRSKRALERDLEEAYVAGDEDVLAAFQLITNDDVKRKAQDVTTELVEQLKKAGKNPKWYVSEVWLESTYGRKGEPRLEQAERAGARDHEEPTRPKPRKGEANASRDPKPGSESEHGESDGIYLPDDIEFLKERIRVLEREKAEESERNEKREAKLFEQLEVKDKQISAWDEVTQGLTRGLATGLIMPALSAGSPAKRPSPSRTATQDVRRRPKAHTVVEAPKSPAIDAAIVNGTEEEKRTHVQKKPRKPRGKAAKAKSSAKKGTARKKAPPKKTKPLPKKDDKRGFFSRLFP